MPPIPDDAPDAELVQRMRAGESGSLRVLYKRYSKLVYSVALKMLGQPSEAEDLTQEVFLFFWKRENFDPSRAALGTYLCVMVRSRALNRLASRESLQRTMDRLQWEPSPELLRPTPLELASCAEKEETVHHALTQLPEKYRQVLELNYYQGLSHGAISKQLGIPLGTVKTHARRGLLLLRQLLGGGVE